MKEFNRTALFIGGIAYAGLGAFALYMGEYDAAQHAQLISALFVIAGFMYK